MVIHRGRAWKRAILLCTALVVIGAGMASAHEGGWGGGEHPGKQHQHEFRKISKQLGLSDSQKAQAQAIFDGNRDVAKQIHTNLRAERKNLQALIHADSVDEAAIRAETTKMAAILADLNVNRAKTGAQFRAILTPPQREILKNMHNEKHPKRGMERDPEE